MSERLHLIINHISTISEREAALHDSLPLVPVDAVEWEIYCHSVPFTTDWRRIELNDGIGTETIYFLLHNLIAGRARARSSCISIRRLSSTQSEMDDACFPFVIVRFWILFKIPIICRRLLANAFNLMPPLLLAGCTDEWYTLATRMYVFSSQKQITCAAFGKSTYSHMDGMI